MPTIKEVAAHTGLSASTVSAVLRGDADFLRISSASQEKIWDAAKELGYKPNIAARRLRDKANDNIVIAVFWGNDFRAPLMVRFLRGLQKALSDSESKCEIVIHPYENGALSDEASLKGINTFHAAIICNMNDKDMEFLESNRFYVPIVLYNRHSDKYCTANVNDYHLGSIPAEVFAQRKHKLAAILTSKAAFQGMNDRITGFLDTCEKNQIKVIEPIYVDNSMAGGYEGALGLCDYKLLPDCLYCASDALALGALRAFHQKALKIPEQLELISIGNGDKEHEEYAWPSLSIVHLPMEKMAAACLDLLLKLLSGKVSPPFSIELPVEYIRRESCGGINESN